MRTQTQVPTSPRLLLDHLITAVGYGGNFIAFTLPAPTLTDVTGFPAGTVSLVILLYGASVAGDIIGGKLGNRIGAVPSLNIIFAGLAGLLAAPGTALTNKVVTVAVAAFWGGFAFASVPPLQFCVVQTAREVAPAPWMWPRA
ncbi:hypothetical protein [Cribrihabitans pelagius]|uniref:hypothetical protein n=1 Tax=Cribrihabitans pelagius TaxID=1765746 RepID=UPI003B5C132C